MVSGLVGWDKAEAVVDEILGSELWRDVQADAWDQGNVAANFGKRPPDNPYLES
jgi:hypothetical protein